MSGPGASIRDGEGLLAADTGRMLAAVSSAGAQVRAVAEHDLRLEDGRPRALVLVGPSAVVDAAVLSAVLPQSPAPIIGSVDLPAWVGALDVVLVSAGAVDDDRSAVAAQGALRRGARTVVRASTRGPVADAAGSALFGVEIAVPEVLAAPGRWALAARVAGAAGLTPTPDLTRWADRLDAAAAGLRPVAESYLNPAANLAEHLLDGTGLLLGADPRADALGRHAARVLIELAGVVVGVLPSTRATGPQPVLAGVGVDRDLFADPFDEPGQQIRPVLMSTIDPTGPDRTGAALLSALRRAVPTAFTLEQTLSDDRPEAPLDPWERTLALGQILDTAATFLAVSRGVPLPADHPAGLGRSAGSRWDLRAAPAPGRAADDRYDLES